VNNKFVATGDFEGFLHVFDRQTGNLVGRRKVDSNGVRAPMIISGDTIYLLDNSGTLSAWNVNYN
jgi:outer membrane protein assembly factor BamB